MRRIGVCALDGELECFRVFPVQVAETRGIFGSSEILIPGRDHFLHSRARGLVLQQVGEAFFDDIQHDVDGNGCAW